MRSDFHEFIELWPAQQQTKEQIWYQGTADAVYQNLSIIGDVNPKYIVVLAGDHVYKQDYSIMLYNHIAAGAGIPEVSDDVNYDATGTKFHYESIETSPGTHFLSNYRAKNIFVNEISVDSDGNYSEYSFN